MNIVSSKSGETAEAKKQKEKEEISIMVTSRWDPFTDLVTLREAMGSLFDRSYVRSGQPGNQETAGTRNMPLDVYEKDNAYIIRAYLPGSKAEDVDIDVDNTTMTIKAHIPSELEQEEAKGYKWLLGELGYGDVGRSITMPSQINAGKIEAVVENGVLTLTVPKAEEAKPKKIAVKSK